jgi:hypothetical protein
VLWFAVFIIHWYSNQLHRKTATNDTWKPPHITSQHDTTIPPASQYIYKYRKVNKPNIANHSINNSDSKRYTEYHVTTQNTMHQTSAAMPKSIRYEQEASRKKYEDITINLSIMHTQLKTKIHNHLGLPQKTKQVQHNTSPPPPPKNYYFYVYFYIYICF